MATDWNKMTVMQLKAELASKGLDASGKKAELVERLEKYEDENGPSPPSVEVEESKENGDDETMADGGETAETAEEATTETAEAADTETADADAEEKMETDDKAEGDKAEGEEEEKKEEEEEEKVDEGPDISTIAKGHCISLDDGTKIVIPSREIIKIDLKQHSRVKAVVVYPIKVEDLANNTFQEHIERAAHFTISFQEYNHEKIRTENGYLEMRFPTRADAEEVTEQLETLRDDLKVKLCEAKDQTNQVVAELKGVELNERNQDAILNRHVYIGNLPASATEQELEALFPDAVRVAVIYNEDKIFKGYALAEFPTEESADRAIKMYHNVGFDDRTLVILKAWNKVPKGLLDHQTRFDLLKNVRLLKGRIKGKSSWQYNQNQKRKSQNEMDMYKFRLDKDCSVRTDLGLSAPPDVIYRENLRKEQGDNKDESESDDSVAENKEGDKKPTPKKKQENRQSYQQKQKRYTPSGPGRMRGGRGNWSSGGRYDSMGRGGGYGGGDSGYGRQAAGMSGGGPGNYNQAMKMLMQVSHMLGSGPSSGMGGGASGYGGSAGYGGYGSNMGGGSGYSGSAAGTGGYGGGYSSGGNSGYGANKMQRRW